MDALSGGVQLVAGQRDHVEGVHHGGGVGDGFGGGGLEAGEAVHGHDGDPGPELVGLSLQPGLERLLRATLDQVQQPGGAGVVPDRGEVDDHGHVLVALAGVSPSVLVDADDLDAVEPSRVVDEELGPDVGHGHVGGVPADVQHGGDTADRGVIEHDLAQGPPVRGPGQLRPRSGHRLQRMPPHPPTPIAAEPGHPDRQPRRPSAHGQVGEPA